MRPCLSLITLSLRTVLRSRGFCGGALAFYTLLFVLSFVVTGTATEEGRIRFYVSLAWILLFAYTLSIVLFLPLGFLAKERENRLLYLPATRPVSKLQIIAARFLSSLIVGGAALSAGWGIIQAGTGVLAQRLGTDLSFLSGCAVHRVPPRRVSRERVRRLAASLSRDQSFLEAYGRERIELIAGYALSVRRLKGGESARMVWTGLEGPFKGAKIRSVPRIHPPWKEVEAKFTVGGKSFDRVLQTATLTEIPLGEQAFSGRGRLELGVEILTEENVLVSFPGAEGMCVYIPRITFAGNLMRACLLLFPFLVGMSALGVLSGVSLSYSVGLLVVWVLLFLGLGYPVLNEAVEGFTGPLVHHHGPGPAPEPIPLALRKVWQKALEWLLDILPDLGGVNPASELSEGRRIGFGTIARSLFQDAFLRGGAVFLLSWFFMHRLEVAKRR